MTAEAYTAQLKAMQERHKAEINNLHIAYARGQRKFKAGDIIREFDRTIQVIGFSTELSFSSAPIPVYVGLPLKKDLTPKKNANRNRESIYGNANVVLIKSV